MPAEFRPNPPVGDIASEDCDEDAEDVTGQLVGQGSGDRTNFGFPVPAYPVGLRFQRGQILQAGQGGLNPCCCFTWMCNGTCTLLIGCVVIATVFIAFGSIYLASSISSILQPLIFIVPRILDHASSGRIKIPEQNYTVLQLLDEQAVIDASKHMDIVVAIEGAMFLLIPGIFLFVASFKLDKVLCLVFLGLAATGTLCDVVGSIYLTVKVSQLNLRTTVEKREDELKFAAILYIWLTTAIEISIKLYAALCSFGFYKQIRAGEYNYLNPQYPQYGPVARGPVPPMPYK